MHWWDLKLWILILKSFFSKLLNLENEYNKYLKTTAIFKIYELTLQEEKLYSVAEMKACVDLLSNGFVLIIAQCLQAVLIEEVVSRCQIFNQNIVVSTYVHQQLLHPAHQVLKRLHSSLFNHVNMQIIVILQRFGGCAVDTDAIYWILLLSFDFFCLLNYDLPGSTLLILFEQ